MEKTEFKKKFLRQLIREFLSMVAGGSILLTILFFFDSYIFSDCNLTYLQMNVIAIMATFAFSIKKISDLVANKIVSTF
ncbi:hypothetical protein [Vibrio sp. WXL210]|uniref:hypothetical protein n=1 Tax=Vibrio sp. WXL210 TaxID=3450709 RepID=UPI003EC838A7